MAGNCEHITIKPVHRLNWLKTIKVCVLCNKRTIWPGKKMFKCVDCKKYLHRHCTKAARIQETAENAEALDVRPVAECVANVEITGVDLAEFEIPGVKNSQAQTCDSASVDISTLDCEKYNRCLKTVAVSEICVVSEQLVHEEHNTPTISALYLFRHLLFGREKRILSPIVITSPFHVKSRFTKDDYLQLASTWEKLGSRQRRNYFARKVYSITYYNSNNQ